MKITQNNFIRIRICNFNILYFKTLTDSPTEEEWKSANEMVNLWYDHCEKKNIKVGLLFNLNSLTFLEPQYYIDWAEQFKKNAHRTEKYVIGSALIIKNVIIRYFINIFFLLYNPIKPIKLVKNRTEGIEFIRNLKSEE